MKNHELCCREIEMRVGWTRVAGIGWEDIGKAAWRKHETRSLSMGPAHCFDFPCFWVLSMFSSPLPSGYAAMGFSMELKEAPAENSDQLCPHSGWCSWNFRCWHVFLLTFVLFTGTGETARLVAFTSTLMDPSLDLKHQV